jgi:TolB-like protein/Tfp pilus assembly protein PilF
MGKFLEELKRRNVFRVGVAYLVTAWLLLQMADVVLGNIGTPPWVFKAILVVLATGFPIALLFAWAFELTPEGLKKEKDVDRSQSITQVTGKKLEYFTIGALSLVVIFFVAREFVFPHGDHQDHEAGVAQGSEPVSIAVLPFADFSENADQAYFSRGISEEILNLLAKTHGLRVAARTSSFAFAAGDHDIREIGDKLDVDTVLEGSIRKSGNTIRITAQLINIEDGYHLWSETYDRDLDDIFKIQDEIAGSILASLKVHLLGEEEHTVMAERARDLDAYSDYLIGKERLALATREDIEAARDKFEQAIERDPDYAPARAALAHAWLLLEREEYGKADKKEVDAVVVPQLHKALELSPDLPEAIAIRGLHHLQRYRYEEARNDLNRAIHLNPNDALAYLWRSETWYEQEQYLQMLADKEKAYSLDPMSLEIAAQLAFDYGSFWRPRDADRIIARMFELHPGHPRAYRALAGNLSNHGHYAEAALLLEEAMQAHPDADVFPQWHAWMLFTIGLYDEAAAQNQDVVTVWVLMAQDRMEEARALLEKGLKEDLDQYWLWAAQTYYEVMRNELGVEPLKSAAARQLAWMEDNGIPWREQCHPYLIFDLRTSGVEDGVDEMMEECRKRTEERLKAGYLCPCTFFDLVLFATLDGRSEQAAERALEWLDNGDSFSWLSADPILQEWSDRPEYEQMLIRNAEQVARQQQIYLEGVAARDKGKQTPSP